MVLPRVDSSLVQSSHNSFFIRFSGALLLFFILEIVMMIMTYLWMVMTMKIIMNLHVVMLMEITAMTVHKDILILKMIVQMMERVIP